MAVDMFLKMEGIDGESRDDGHSQWIEIESFSWGVSQTGSFSSGGGGGAGRATVQDFSITKRLDKASPKLMEACATGRHLPAVQIDLARTRNDKQVYMRYKMSDVLVSSYRPAGGSGDPAPSEELSLNFTKITMVYREIDPSSNKVVSEVEASHTIKLGR